MARSMMFALGKGWHGVQLLCYWNSRSPPVPRGYFVQASCTLTHKAFEGERVGGGVGGRGRRRRRRKTCLRHACGHVAPPALLGLIAESFRERINTRHHNERVHRRRAAGRHAAFLRPRPPQAYRNPHTPGGVAAFMPAHSEPQCVIHDMEFPLARQGTW